MSYGGVMAKNWNFEEEGESIQWTCLGELKQIDYQNKPVSHSAANYTSVDNLPTPLVSHDRFTFGPFIQKQINTKPDPGVQVHEKVPAILVFIRSITQNISTQWYGLHLFSTLHRSESLAYFASRRHNPACPRTY